MESIKKREIALCIIFSIITCGIYMYYWMYKINNEINIITDNQEDTSGALVVVFSIITCGIYSIYWAYSIGKKLDIYYEKNNNHQKSDNAILFLILLIANYVTCGILSFICYSIMQDHINKLIAKQ